MNKLTDTVNAAVARWNTYWEADASPYPLAAFRVLFGLYLLVYWGVMLPHVSVLFSSDGVVLPYAIMLPAPPPLIAWILFTLLLALCVALIAGYKTRWTAPALLIVFLYHYCLNIGYSSSTPEAMCIIFLITLCLCPCSAVWSMDARQRNDNNDIEPTVPIWPARFMGLFLSLLYFGTGLFKLLNPAWADGIIIEKIMIFTFASPLAVWIIQLGLPHAVFNALAICTVFFELSIGFLLWQRPVQKWVMVAGLLFHISIWLTLNIPEFLICPVVYVLFLPGNEVKHVVEGIMQQAKRLRTIINKMA